jgi:hypothetical protein
VHYAVTEVREEISSGTQRSLYGSHQSHYRFCERVSRPSLHRTIVLYANEQSQYRKHNDYPKPIVAP